MCPNEDMRSRGDNMSFLFTVSIDAKFCNLYEFMYLQEDFFGIKDFQDQERDLIVLETNISLTKSSLLMLRFFDLRIIFISTLIADGL